MLLLLLAPAIPELLTGSTPISELALDPFRFALAFGFEVGLYGGGVLLIREFTVALRKGWASVLLLGGAYGIVEEGLAVHTFFRTSGAPVGVLGQFGHAFGVNWLWALGLTTFHATYSIALPILLVGLRYPEVRSDRWLDGSALAVVAAIFVGVVALFSANEAYPPTPGALVLFLGVIAALVAAAATVPAALLSVPDGPGRAGPSGLVLAGTLGFDAWVLVLLLAANGRVPAAIVAVLFVGIDLGALAYVVRRVGAAGLERSEFYFATGMLLALWVWDIPLEFSIPGILGVAAVAAYLQYRLGRRVLRRGPVPEPGPGRPVG